MSSANEVSMGSETIVYRRINGRVVPIKSNQNNQPRSRGNRSEKIGRATIGAASTGYFLNAIRNESKISKRFASAAMNAELYSISQWTRLNKLRRTDSAQFGKKSPLLKKLATKNTKRAAAFAKRLQNYKSLTRLSKGGAMIAAGSTVINAVDAYYSKR